MYIRRKVYSVFEDENGEIRYFSTNEIMSEEEYLENLYSEDYLDDDDMERLFAEKDYDKGLSKGAKIAIGAGSAAAAATALHFGGAAAAKKASKGFEMNMAERGLAKVNQGEKWLWNKTGAKVVAKAGAKKEAGRVAKAGLNNFGKADLAKLDEKSLADMLANEAITKKEYNAAIKAKAAAEAAAKKAKEKELKNAKATVEKNKKRILAERAKREGKTYETYADQARLAKKGFSSYED